MKVRSHLLLLTLGILLPIVVLGVIATVLLSRREFATFQRGASERTRALVTALDAELSRHSPLLRAIANARSLESGDLRTFHEAARRVLANQADWTSIALDLPTGQRVLNAAVPFDSAVSPVHDRASFEKALTSGEPAVGNLVNVGGEHRFAIRVPVRVQNETRYVLSALVDPRSILNLLTEQRLPPDWVGVVLDANGAIVARTIDYEGTLGKPGSESLRSALARGNEGWFHGETIEGADVYTPFSTSALTGWTVAMGIPAHVVESGPRRTAFGFALAVGLALALAIAFAFGLSRRIAAPIAALASTARALGRGAPHIPAGTDGVDEVREVGRALTEASDAVRQREDALRAADRAKDEFLAMLGHELRNPLGALTSAVRILHLTGPKDESSAMATAVLERQVQHMTRLVDDLLDVSRVTSGKITLSRRQLNLATVTQGTVKTLTASGRLGQHTVRCDMQDAWTFADEARVEQIVTNLVENAAKYTPDRGRITIRTFMRDDQAVLEVEDTGIGMEPDLIPRVFDLFVQSEQSLDRRLGGLGIGLTLVQRLAALHGGTASAHSDGYGKGSRFTIAFPAAVEQGPIERAPDPGAARSGGGRRLKVLLIEDNEDARKSLAIILGLAGHTVREAADGNAGIAAAAEFHPDVAVIDIGLPGLDGYEVARRLSAQNNGSAPTMRLIALTGYGEAEARRQAVEAGFHRYLTKPAAPEELIRLIEE